MSETAIEATKNKNTENNDDTTSQKIIDNSSLQPESVDEKTRSVSGETNEVEKNQEDDNNTAAANTTTIDATAELNTVDPELEQIKQRVREMEQEAERLKIMQQTVERDVAENSGGIHNLHHRHNKTSHHSHHHHNPHLGGSHVVGGHVFPTLDEKIEADARSIYKIL